MSFLASPSSPGVHSLGAWFVEAHPDREGWSRAWFSTDWFLQNRSYGSPGGDPRHNLWAQTGPLDKLDAADRADDLRVDADGEKAFLLVDRSLRTVVLKDGKVEPVKLEAKMELDAGAERAYLFEHAWRQTREKFYVEDLHGVDWDLYKEAYARFLPHIDNNWDLAELISEMQGELNASHLGCRYRPSRPGADATASLGIFPDTGHDGAGIAAHTAGADRMPDGRS